MKEVKMQQLIRNRLYLQVGALVNVEKALNRDEGQKYNWKTSLMTSSTATEQAKPRERG